jgi:hypothetical protein
MGPEMNLLLQPATTETRSRCLFYRTIENRLGQKLLEEALPPRGFAALASETAGKPPCAWGLRADPAGRNRQVFDGLESGDLALFGGATGAIAWGNVAWKIESPGLAVRLWDRPDDPLRLVYFLHPVGFFEEPIPRSAINRCAGFESGRIWTGASFVPEAGILPVIELMRIHGFPRIAA